MKKRLPVVLVAALVLAAVLGATAYAASAHDIVSAANASIAQEISQAVAQANQATLVYKTTVAAVNSVGGDPRLLALCRSIYDARLDQIGSALVSKTDRIADKAISACAALGVTVICEYTPVTLGDRIVYVDPLVVIGD